MASDDDRNGDEDQEVAETPKLVSEEIARREHQLLMEAAPTEVSDLASACVRFVTKAVGVQLDYTVETLPILDHYLAGARAVLAAKEVGEPLEVVAQTAGAYLGEVIRRRFPCFWVLTPADPTEHRLQFMRLFLTVKPVAWVLDSLLLDPEKAQESLSGLVLDREDRDLCIGRLADLPEVTDEDFVRPSTRLEVLDLVVDAITTKQSLNHEPALSLEEEDYLDG